MVVVEQRQRFAKQKNRGRELCREGEMGQQPRPMSWGALLCPLPYIYMCGRAGSPTLLLIGVGAKGESTWTPSPILFLLGLLFFPFPSRMGF
jgi:hypothetical protein